MESRYDLAHRIAQSLMGIANITMIFTSQREILLKAAPVVSLSGMNGVIESKLAQLGYKAEVLSTEPELVVRLRTRDEVRPKTKFPWLNLLLFAFTGITTILAGAFREGVNFLADPGMFLREPSIIIRAGLPFSLSLLPILLFHEFGHYAAARIHKVRVTLPYFIPAPTLLGTFGAFIRSKSAFINKKQLLDIAAAGPLAGLTVSIIVLLIGIRGSSFAPLGNLDGIDFYYGQSILHKAIMLLVKGPIPFGQFLKLNSIAFAGWVGLLVTMFNLLPIGQLDGGHIMYALFGRYQRYLAYAAMLGILTFSFWWAGWALWLLVSIILKPAHPPTLMDEIPIGRRRRIVGYLCIAAFILCFMPVPVWY
jgi:Zn-dependent protease